MAEESQQQQKKDKNYRCFAAVLAVKNLPALNA